MKLCRLKLKNLNSFRESVEIDFEKSPLDDASLVAITGPTGSGKTTLLDAICVALYGKTPRLSGTTSQHPRHLISHGETESFAEVYFEADNTRYHATWSIRRNQSPKAQLFNGSGELITTNVAQEVESILGLDFGAFRRSVMLAQGEFAAFLKASNENRRTILEAAAGVHIYDILRDALNHKVAEVQAVYDKIIDELNKIPPSSREQVTDAEKELSRLQKDTGELAAQSQQILQEKERETKRTEGFEQLQSSEKRREGLLDQQLRIDTLESERKLAEKAQRLRPEKQEFDNAKSELEKAIAALSSAETKKTGAEEQVETDQVIYNEKATEYQAASDDQNQKMPVYAIAKLNVEQAEGKFADANKQMPGLANLSDQIDALEGQLDDRRTKQAEWQEQIEGAQRFLEDNPLPSDRQSRLNRATGLLVQLGSQENQLDTALTSKAQHEAKVSSSKREIEELSKTRDEHISEKVGAETALENADSELKMLLATGTYDEWNSRKQQASKAQPIAQKYEATQDDLSDAENQLNALNATAATLDVKLEQLETDLASQTEVCQEAAEVVQRCEAEKESAKWANPINQLRQHLHAGEPCRVCGAMEHPYADVVEDENEDLLQDAETALVGAKTEAQTAQDRLQALTTKQTQIEQNRRNIAEQIETHTTKIETLQEDTAKLLTEWQVIYLDIDVLSAWISEQFDITDTAIADLGEAKLTHTQASNALRIVSQQLETCENDIKRETKDLNDTETQLADLNNTIADLLSDVAATEIRFWEFMPDAFHGVKPTQAVDQFDSKIKEVEKRENERRNAKTQLQQVETHIDVNQSNLEGLKDRYKKLETEIDGYQREGEAFLDAVREKTDGLTTKDEIDTAIKNLAMTLRAKETERDEADSQLQESLKLSIQKQADYENCEKQRESCDKKFETARTVYFDKLAEAGFDTPETHDNAFREDDQLQEITDQIDAHKNEIQRLALEITELQTRFDETPFDPEALGRIEIKLEEIETQLQAKREEIGAQGERVDNLKDALEKREALADKLREAQQELERWQRLQDIIPRNDLRDFALEIMFRQMGSLANEQLKYLTSERYQLKVEGIGDLSVVDHWNANEERPVETLSGGESFLTSLALALALSELSRGRSQLNSLFLDEGFGTLDTETLDTAIAALEGLRMQGRNIFLISHIRELTRRLPVKIEVNKKGNGSSSVRIPD